MVDENVVDIESRYKSPAHEKLSSSSVFQDKNVVHENKDRHKEECKDSHHRMECRQMHPKWHYQNWGKGSCIKQFVQAFGASTKECWNADTVEDCF